jgi:hypothetical protein
MFNALLNLSDVHLYAGNSSPINYYLNLGIEMAQKYKSMSYQTIFYLRLGFLSRKQHIFTEGSNYIKTAEKLSISVLVD